MFSQQEVGSSGQKFVSFSQTNTHTATSYSRLLAGQAFNHRPPSAQLEAKMKLRDSDDTKSQLLESPQHQYSKNISTEQPSKPYKVTDKFHKDTKI
ncbi:hypothetical protein Q8A67_019804 [Cirrhinus molitorella]|uniref:Uncharacterized protein n=1 Tax=Cirrhinus molitorella TaxID=172907 RepID=A0AA88TQ22_9TELE|nr:hypothetical protein Q8A67_019804 [Cirrhinus molitorella]